MNRQSPVRILAGVLVGLLLGLFPLELAQSQTESPRPTIPWVVMGRYWGSATIISRTEFLTAWHVTPEEQEGLVVYGGRSYRVQKIKEDHLVDVALLRTSIPTSIPLDPLSPCGMEARKGAYVRVRGLRHEDSEGTVLGVVDNEDRGLNLYHTAIVLGGDSGGPVFDVNGQVLGMTIGFTVVPKTGVAVYYKSLWVFLGQPCP